MKNLFEFYYNLYDIEFKENNDIITFNYNFADYFFVPLNRPKEDLQLIYDISLELLSRNIPCHSLILNKDNNLITNYNNKEYILFKTNEKYSEEISLFNIDKEISKLILNDNNSKLYRNNWGKLWEEKVDYFEYQMSKLSKDKKIVLNSFSYYLGLAENAISYANESYKQFYNNEKLTLSHKRIFSPNYALNYYNPLSFIFDYISRDIGEYIKASYFNNDLSINEIEIYINKKNFSNFEANMLIARLLYPSYYFDIYEKIMNNNEDETKLLKIIEKADDYERFLNKIYHLLIKKNPLLKVDWIFKDQQ